MNRTPATLTIRVSNSERDALDKLPSPLTASTLVRALLREYLAGTLPEWVDAKILEECSTSVEARKRVRFKPGHRPWNTSPAGVSKCQSKNQVPSIPQALRFQLPSKSKETPKQQS